MSNDDFYVRYYVGHKGKFGHEFLEFEFRPDGKACCPAALFWSGEWRFAVPRSCAAWHCVIFPWHAEPNSFACNVVGRQAVSPFGW